jgi:hypothetical protein
MFSCLTPTPFWKPMIASYRSPRLLPRKRWRSISGQHLRLTKVESRFSIRSCGIDWSISPLENRSTHHSGGQHLSFHIDSPLASVRIIGNPCRSMKYRRQEFDRVSKDGQALGSLPPSCATRNPNLLMQRSVPSSRDNRSGNWRASWWVCDLQLSTFRAGWPWT